MSNPFKNPGALSSDTIIAGKIIDAHFGPGQSQAFLFITVQDISHRAYGSTAELRLPAANRRGIRKNLAKQVAPFLGYQPAAVDEQVLADLIGTAAHCEIVVVGPFVRVGKVLGHIPPEQIASLESNASEALAE